MALADATCLTGLVAEIYAPRIGFGSTPALMGRGGLTSRSCGRHPLQRHEAADVGDEVGEGGPRPRPNPFGRADGPAARRRLLRPEHVLDASPGLALPSGGRLLRLWQPAIAARADMDAALEP